MSFASLNQVTVSKPPQAATELHPTNLKSPINVAPLPPPAVKGHGQAQPATSSGCTAGADASAWQKQSSSYCRYPTFMAMTSVTQHSKSIHSHGRMAVAVGDSAAAQSTMNNTSCSNPYITPSTLHNSCNIISSPQHWHAPAAIPAAHLAPSDGPATAVEAVNRRCPCTCKQQRWTRQQQQPHQTRTHIHQQQIYQQRY